MSVLVGCIFVVLTLFIYNTAKNMRSGLFKQIFCLLEVFFSGASNINHKQGAINLRGEKHGIGQTEKGRSIEDHDLSFIMLESDKEALHGF